MEKANGGSFARRTRKTAEDEEDWDITLTAGLYPPIEEKAFQPGDTPTSSISETGWSICLASRPQLNTRLILIWPASKNPEDELEFEYDMRTDCEEKALLDRAEISLGSNLSIGRRLAIVLDRRSRGLLDGRRTNGESKRWE